MTVELQISTWEKSQKKLKFDFGQYEIFETPLKQIAFTAQLGDYPEQDLKAITNAVGVKNAKLAHTWEILPYTVRCVGNAIKVLEDGASSSERSKENAKVSGEEHMVSDVDEW